jgi:hypothetical protein
VRDVLAHRKTNPLFDHARWDSWLDGELKRHRTHIHNEINHHAKLSFANHPGILKLRGASMRGGDDLNVVKRYVAFIEFAKHGTLCELIDHYKQIKKQNIPEIFIWRLLGNLVDACFVLEAHDLIHHDIKVIPPLLTFLLLTCIKDFEHPYKGSPTSGRQH